MLPASTPPPPPDAFAERASPAAPSEGRKDSPCADGFSEADDEDTTVAGSIPTSL